MDINAAESIKEASSGIASMVPVLDKHPRGAAFALALILAAGGAIALPLYFTQVGKTKKPVEEVKTVEPSPQAGIEVIERSEEGSTFRVKD
ncbi:MAG: hypothetical protein ACRCYP_01590 [Alphaproteobacteria bacterium]